MQEYCFGRKRAEPSLTPQPEPGRGHGDTGEAALDPDRESAGNVNIYKSWVHGSSCIILDAESDCCL